MSGITPKSFSYRSLAHLFLRMLFYLWLFGIFFSLSFALVYDPDFGWHIRYGKEIVEKNRILTVDTFTHTISGNPLVDNEWLSEAIFYLLFTNFSFFGLSFFVAGITALALFIPIAGISGRWEIKSLLAILSLIGSNSFLRVGPRPQNFTLLLFSLLYLCLLYYSESKKVRFIVFLPFLLLLWANMHPGYMLGIGVIVLFIVAELFRTILESRKRKNGSLRYIFPLCLVLIFSVLFSMVRPYSEKVTGPSGSLLQAIFLPAKLASETSIIGTVRTSISEWLPPILVDIPGTLLLFGVIAVVGLFALKNFTSRDVVPLILISFFVYFATLSRRNTPFFFLGISPIVLLSFKKYINEFIAWKGVKVGIIVLMVGVTWNAVTRLNENISLVRAVEKKDTLYCQTLNYPCGAIEYIRRTKPSGNLYNFYTWGGYLDLVLPEYPVFIDGRIPGSILYEEFERVFTLHKSWEEILTKYHVNIILIPRHRLFEELVTHDGKWKIAYTDDSSVVLVRN